MDIRDIVYVTEEDIQDVVVRWGLRDMCSFTAENSRTSCPCDYIDHQPKVRETLNLTVTAVKYAVYTKCKCILQQIWVEMRIFHRSKLHKPHPGPGFRAGRLIQAALTVFVIIKVDLKFFSLVYTWVKMSRGSKYHESVGLIKPSHNRANPAASPVSILYIGEIHTFEYID